MISFTTNAEVYNKLPVQFVTDTIIIVNDMGKITEVNIEQIERLHINEFDKSRTILVVVIPITIMLGLIIYDLENNWTVKF